MVMVVVDGALRTRGKTTRGYMRESNMLYHYNSFRLRLRLDGVENSLPLMDWLRESSAKRCSDRTWCLMNVFAAT